MTQSSPKAFGRRSAARPGSLGKREQCGLDAEINGFTEEGLLGQGVSALIGQAVAIPQRVDQRLSTRIGSDSR